MRRTLVALLALTALLPAAAHAAADDLVVIVNEDSGVERLTPAEAVNIFMGRYRSLPSGLVAFPIDIGERSPERTVFYRRLVGRELAEVDAYWARLVFSGQTSPPLRVPDGRTAVALVAGNRAAIAYVRRADAGTRVRIVLDLQDEAR